MPLNFREGRREETSYGWGWQGTKHYPAPTQYKMGGKSCIISAPPQRRKDCIWQQIDSFNKNLRNDLWKIPYVPHLDFMRYQNISLGCYLLEHYTEQENKAYQSWIQIHSGLKYWMFVRFPWKNK